MMGGMVHIDQILVCGTSYYNMDDFLSSLYAIEENLMRKFMFKYYMHTFV